MIDMPIILIQILLTVLVLYPWVSWKVRGRFKTFGRNRVPYYSSELLFKNTMIKPGHWMHRLFIDKTNNFHIDPWHIKPMAYELIIIYADFLIGIGIGIGYLIMELNGLDVTWVKYAYLGSLVAFAIFFLGNGLWLDHKSKKFEQEWLFDYSDSQRERVKWEIKKLYPHFFDEQEYKKKRTIHRKK